MKDKLKQLQRVIPFHFRVWSNVWADKCMVLGYIDARDAMDLLDEVTWWMWQRDHKEVAGKTLWGIWIPIDWQTYWKRDAGTESNTEKEKWQISDSFKRAAVNWWVGRFLYSLPTMIITKEEARENKYDLTSFVRSKFSKQLKERHESLPDHIKNANKSK